VVQPADASPASPTAAMTSFVSLCDLKTDKGKMNSVLVLLGICLFNIMDSVGIATVQRTRWLLMGVVTKFN
jgi:hypothetical protein